MQAHEEEGMRQVGKNFLLVVMAVMIAGVIPHGMISLVDGWHWYGGVVLVVGCLMLPFLAFGMARYHGRGIDIDIWGIVGAIVAAVVSIVALIYF